MSTHRERHERQAKLFGPNAFRHALDAITDQRDGFGLLPLLDDETVARIARYLLATGRRTDAMNRRNRALIAERQAIGAHRLVNESLKIAAE
jgi:hypothetical protein